MGQWISVDATLIAHRKLRRLMAALGEADQLRAFGGLVLLWSAVRRESPDGVLAGWGDDDISAAMLRPPGEDPSLARKALESAGLVDRFPDGALSVHDWQGCNGRWIKDAERKRQERSRRSSSVQGRSTDAPRMSSDGPTPSVDRAHAGSRAEQSRETHMLDAAASSARPVPPLELLNGNGSPTAEDDWRSGFDAIYRAYPRHVSPKTAMKAYLKLQPKGGNQEARNDAYTVILHGIEDWCGYWSEHGTPKDKIPYLATFLNDGRHAQVPE